MDSSASLRVEVVTFSGFGGRGLEIATPGQDNRRCSGTGSCELPPKTRRNVCMHACASYSVCPMLAPIRTTDTGSSVMSWKSIHFQRRQLVVGHLFELSHKVGEGGGVGMGMPLLLC